jgi:flavodoxin
MKIGIIIYSQTGHTQFVARKIQNRLLEAENDVDIEKIQAINSSSKTLTIENPPDLEAFEALIFGAPVHAFALAPAMRIFMEGMSTLSGKKIACYVTKGLPFHRTGGNQSISKMKEICQSKDGKVLGTDILIWKGEQDKKIDSLVNKFGIIFR